MQIFTFINTRKETESKWKYVPPVDANSVYFQPISCTLLHVICIVYIFAHPYFPQMYTYPRCNNENWKLKKRKGICSRVSPVLGNGVRLGWQSRIESGRYNWRSVGRQKSRILVRNRCTSWRRSCTWRPSRPWERFRLDAPMPLLSSPTCRSNGHASSTLSARFVDVGRISCLCHPTFSPIFFLFFFMYI